jgi:hypothetical protein
MSIHKQYGNDKWISLEKLNNLVLSAEEFEKILIPYGDQFSDVLVKKNKSCFSEILYEFYLTKITNPTLNRLLNKLFDRRELIKVFDKIKRFSPYNIKKTDENWEIVWEYLMFGNSDLSLGKFVFLGGYWAIDHEDLFYSEFYETKMRNRLRHSPLKGSVILKQYVERHFSIYSNPNDEIFLENISFDDALPKELTEKDGDINLKIFLKSEIVRRGINMSALPEKIKNILF